MAALPGNQYAAKAQRVSRAIERALAADNWRRLHLGAEKIADAFAAGERWAAELVLDRLEGKAIARVEVANAEARELDLAAVMSLVLQARKAEAIDAPQVIDSAAETVRDAPQAEL